MKLGRTLNVGPDGSVARLVVVEPEAGRVIDIAKAERIRRERAGAQPRAAARIARALFPGSMTEALETGPRFKERIARAVDSASDDASDPLDGVTWLSPVDPPLLRDCLLFETHLQNAYRRLGSTVPEHFFDFPRYYKGNPSTIIGPNRVVPWPRTCERFDYELELGFVVGGSGRNLQPEEAEQLLFGVTIMNDFSARDVQAREKSAGMGPAKAKDFGTSFGPWVTTMDELDVMNLDMTARVNGEVWSKGRSGTMTFPPDQVLAYISLSEEIRPGEVVGSGTVGEGCGLELDRWLSPGDVVELTVGGIGSLVNTVGVPERGGWLPPALRDASE